MKSSIDAWVYWANGIIPRVGSRLAAIDEKITEIGDLISTAGPNEIVSIPIDQRSLLAERDSLSSLLWKIEFLQTISGSWFVEAWKGNTYIKPVWPDGLYQRFIGRASERSLWMSATLTGGPKLASLFGIDDYQYIEVPSVFEKQHRPFRYTPVVNLTNKTMDAELPRLIAYVDKVLEHHPEGKGMIHTVSNKLRDAIMNGSKYKSRLMTHETSDRTEKLEVFKLSEEPTVMVSPSFSTGVDLPGVLDFQVVAKVPWAPLNDTRTKLRLTSGERGEQWYVQDAVNTIVQTYGRGMRTPEDRVVTYCPDKQFGALYSRGSEYMPNWFKEAIIWPRKV